MPRDVNQERNVGALLCLKVARRSMAAVYLSGLQITDVRTRALGSDAEEAISSAAAFVRQLLDDSRPERVLLEFVPDASARRSALMDSVLAALAEPLGPSVERVDKAALISSFTTRPHPRVELMRRSVAAIWPELTGYSAALEVLDAAALGLFCWTAHALALPPREESNGDAP